MSTADLVLSALEPLQLKKEGANKYRSNSPLRPGSNSHAFSLTIDDPEHGAYHDHRSGESGSLYDLAVKLNLPVPQRPKLENTKRSYTGLKDYAEAHGVGADVFESAGWHETRRDNRPALTIPTANGERLRYLDGEKPVYKSPFQYQRCWYGLNRAAATAKGIGQSLIICNGEASTVVGQAFALPVCAVTGGEQPSIPEYLIAQLKQVYPNGQIIVAFDCDRAGREKSPTLAVQLRECGYDARAVDLQLDESGDIADFCKLHGAAAATALAACPTLTAQSTQPANARRWRIVPLTDLKNLPEAAWLVPGMVPEAGLAALYGPSGEGKSFFALALAMAVARDQSVIYIAAEGELGYRKRAAAWCKHHGVSEYDLKIAFCMGSVSLLDDQDKEEFIEALAEYKPSLVIVDTVAQTMIGGDENSARDMSLYLRSCRDIMAAYGCATLLVHHTGKSRIDERGSTALRASCDVMIRLSADDDVVRVDCSKTKDEAPFPTKYIRLLPVDVDGIGQSVVAVEAEKVITKPGDPLTVKQQQIMDVLSMNIHIDGCQAGEIESLTALTHGVVAHGLERLCRDHYVQRIDRGLYQITAEGLNLVRCKVNQTLDPTSGSLIGAIDQGSSPHGEAIDPFDRNDRTFSETESGGVPEKVRDQADQTDHVSGIPDISSSKGSILGMLNPRSNSPADRSSDGFFPGIPPADSYYQNGG